MESKVLTFYNRVIIIIELDKRQPHWGNSRREHPIGWWSSWYLHLATTFLASLEDVTLLQNH